MFRLTRPALAAVCLALGLGHSTAQADPVLIDSSVKRISMFKNGVGIVSHQLGIDGSGDYRIAPLPEATWGSLWLTSHPSARLDRVRAREAEYLRPVTRDEIVQAFKDQFGEMSVISLPEDTLDWEILRPVKGPVMDLTINVAERASLDNPEIGMTYLAKGIAWAPSVVIDLQDEDKASVSVKAVVINDLMDLNEVDLEFIAGYPNLKFLDAPTPMSLEPLPHLLGAISQAGRGEGARSHLTNNRYLLQQRFESAPHSAGVPTRPAFPTGPVMGEDAGDLYFYQVPKVTLAKGERGYFPLAQAEVPTKLIHTWDIASFTDTFGRFQQHIADQQQVIWHELELTNATKQPWTTSAAMVRRDGRVLGQDTMFYTAPGATTRVKITQAVGVETRIEETELEREFNSSKFSGSSYHKVLAEGQLEIINHKSEPITIEITKHVSGEVKSVEGDAEIVKLNRMVSGPNSLNKLQWKVEVQPDEKNAVKLTYNYTYYTR